jgi:hypothetical protein
MYAGGLAAVHSGHYGALRALTTDFAYQELNGEVPLIAALHPWRTFENDTGQALNEGTHNRYTPVSDHLHDTLRGPLRQIIPSDEQYTTAFDRLEFLLGMLLADLQATPRQEGLYIPRPFVGSAGWRHKYDQTRSPRDRIGAELNEDTWPPLSGGLFGGSKERADAALAAMSEHYDQARSRWF